MIKQKRLFIGNIFLGSLEWGKNYGKKGFLFRRSWGPGAGYKGGKTLYIGFNTGSLKLTRVEMGLTKNANEVPHMTH